MIQVIEGAGAGEEVLSDEQWEQIRPLLPVAGSKFRKGRPRMSDRQAMEAILYRLRTGCAWKSLPRSLGAGSTVHQRYQQWRRAAVFEKLVQAGILAHDDIEAI